MAANEEIGLTRAMATAIVEIVRKDPECKRVIKSPLSVLPASWGVAGGVRNVGLMGFGMFNPWNSGPSEEESKLVCTGIAEATSEAINKANKKEQTRVRYLKRADSISRVSSLGVHHTATLIVLENGRGFVFDWHATLTIDNPAIYPSGKKFEACSGDVPFRQFTGFP